jgi:hypothetical protein
MTQIKRLPAGSPAGGGQAGIFTEYDIQNRKTKNLLERHS